MNISNNPLSVGYRSSNLSEASSAGFSLEAFTMRFDKTFYKKGETVFKEGSRAWGLYYIASGKIKLYQYGSDGKEQILKIAHSGEFLGYTAVLNHTRYNVSAAALEDAILIFIPQQDFLESFTRERAIAQHFTQLLCRDIIEAEQRITAMAYQPVRSRLAEALLSLDKIYEKEEETSFINLSRQDLASLVGTAKETVIRMLSEFKEEMLIATDGHKIAVLNPKGLMRISQLYI